ncbi:type II secretion system protein GspM [Roseateles amylovorans]|uniref:Type II secretion system protein GspM n=1 Tax=Roseateles amylovorans TaxID=2978473 RepID=A0ABY6AW70_9BURK|nr:type II secretion system protein GspM [Roseateles amylovorans]UXH77429.1 type II secretion system protein GspM [Roseateles amylovorans]
MKARLNALRWPLQRQLKPLVDAAQDRWRALSPRERLQIVGMVVAVVATAVWLLWARPALASIRHWENELPRLRSQAAALKDILGADGQPAARPSAITPQDRLQRLRASLDGAGLAGAYVLSDDGAAIHIEFDRAVDLSKGMAWLLAGPPTLQMKVAQFSLQRLDDRPISASRSDVRFTITIVAT